MKKHNSVFLVITICLSVSISSIAKAQERKIILLDKDWKFINKDMKSAESVDLNDASWKKVCIPHDWAIRKKFDMNLDAQYVKVVEDGDSVSKLRTGRTGALPIFGVGWYRKILPFSVADKGKSVSLEFDGAMSLSKIYINGKLVGEWPYGYSSFAFDITGFVDVEKQNILSVRLENKPESSRWYAGAGIYRNVRLVVTNPVHVVHWGTCITTPIVNEKLAEVNIKTTVKSSETNKNKTLKVVTDIVSKSGVKADSQTSSQLIADDSLTVNQTLKINKPARWSTESPNLYSAVSYIYVDNVLQDKYTTSFGCRSLRFDKDHGFFVNEKPVKIKGVCLHHDLGPLGVAVNFRATERQLVMMKEMGANAIRTSHNPPSPELLQICDSIGLMVMVEAFDEWRNGKNQNGYNLFFDQWHERDICNMIRRDRNHPSVIMWSIGNEIREQDMPQGKAIAHELTAICHREDPTRLTTAGFNNHNAAIKNGLAEEVDIVGFNYKPQDYKAKHLKYPNFTILATETASTVSSRGVYKFPVKENKDAWYNDYQVSSYDMDYPNWAYTPDKEFQAQDDNEFIQGEFVWTGFDYLGEPTPYNEGTPARSSYFGIVDLAGLKKDRYYLYQSKWSDTPVLHVLPHWNWPERIRQKVPVYCYTNYPKAELFVNGLSMGIKQKENTDKFTRYRLMWNDVIYQPGEIKVVAYDVNNQKVAEQIVRTAGEPYAIKLTPDRSSIHADGKDLSFVTVEIVDKEGNLCPRAAQLLFFEVSGAGKLKALCNGDAIDQTPFSSNYMHVFSGKMVAVIESTNTTGEISLKASGSKMEQKTVIKSK